MHSVGVVVEAVGLTRRGLRRETNQDQYLIAALLGRDELAVADTSLADLDRHPVEGPAEGWLLAVADGMRGYSGGEHASAIAVTALVQSLRAALVEEAAAAAGGPPVRAGAIREGLRDGLVEGEERLQAAAESGGPRMGTTLTAALVLGSHLHLAHVGHSRCYLSRGGDLVQLSEDHTFAQELADEGVIEGDRAESNPWRQVLYKAVGGSSPMGEPQAHSVRLAPGDLLLLCTDGLTRQVSDEAIGQLLATPVALEPLAGRFMTLAAATGGEDDATVVLARIGEGPARVERRN